MYTVSFSSAVSQLTPTPYLSKPNMWRFTSSATPAPEPAAQKCAEPQYVLFVKLHAVELKLTLTPKGIAKPLTTAVLTPFLKAYNKRSLLTRPISVADLQSAELDGEPVADFGAPAEALLEQKREAHLLLVAPEPRNVAAPERVAAAPDPAVVAKPPEPAWPTKAELKKHLLSPRFLLGLLFLSRRVSLELCLCFLVALGFSCHARFAAFAGRGSFVERTRLFLSDVYNNV